MRDGRATSVLAKRMPISLLQQWGNFLAPTFQDPKLGKDEGMGHLPGEKGPDVWDKDLCHNSGRQS